MSFSEALKIPPKPPRELRRGSALTFAKSLISQGGFWMARFWSAPAEPRRNYRRQFCRGCHDAEFISFSASSERPLENLVDRKRGGGVIKNPPRQNPGGIGLDSFP